MKVIGAGLPRTATLTLKIALEMLGAGPCYHMVNILTDTSRVSHWADAYAGRADWDKIFDGFESTVDFPSAYFYREIMAAYPEATVVLSVRDGESWARSLRDTIWSAVWGDTLEHHLAMARSHVDPGWQEYVDLMPKLVATSGILPDDPTKFDMAFTVAALERHTEDVRRHVPADRLLIWNPADGWGPLCERLGVPVPDVPLPHVNDRASFNGMVIGGSMAALTGWYEQQADGLP